MNRRTALVSAAAALLTPNALKTTARADQIKEVRTLSPADEASWELLDAQIQHQWSSYLSIATEEVIRKDPSGTLLFLPFPFVSPTGPGSVYRYMFAWDTDFVSRALLAQGNAEQARRHLLNYFHMIDRFGYMPNANVNGLVTRSQTPLIADTTWRYFKATSDRDLLLQAYPRLKRNYRTYWTAPHHQTPIGLATNRDLGDVDLDPRLAAEAETGLDWTPIYAGDVRNCVPLITNCALVRYADRLAAIANEIGRPDEALAFTRESLARAALIRQYCWSDKAGFFMEYDYVRSEQLPCRSDCALWTMWAGVASRAQAKRLVKNLGALERAGGLACTDRPYPLPGAEADYEPACRISPDGVESPNPTAVMGGDGPLQWMYPAGWAPTHLIAVEGLDAYGFGEAAERVATKFLRLMIRQYEATGHLWEKYNVEDETVDMPNARCGNIWMLGWTAAAAVLLGQRLVRKRTLGLL